MLLFDFGLRFWSAFLNSRTCEDCEMRLGTATQMPREVPDAHALRFMPLALPSNTQKRPLGMRGARFLLFRLCGGQCSPLCAAHVKQHA